MACAACSVAKSRLTLCDPVDCSPPSSSVHRTLQARTLDRVAIPSSRGSSHPRDGTHVSCAGRQTLYLWALGAPEVALTTEISHSSGGWKSKLRVWAREGAQWGPFFPVCQRLLSRYVVMWRTESSRVSSSSHKGTSVTMGAVLTWPQLNPNSSQRPHFQITITVRIKALTHTTASIIYQNTLTGKGAYIHKEKEGKQLPTKFEAGMW